MTLINDKQWKDTIRHMTAIVDDVNRRNGWHDDDRPFSADIALLHSEVSEAYEAYRDWKLLDMSQVLYDRDYKTGPIKPQGVGSEMADIFIRLLDTCSRHDINLVYEFIRKMAYNTTRGYKHGGKTE